MRQTWRWFGPDDPITLPMIAEAGAAGVVTALHRHNRGQIWPLSEIEGRRAQIEAAGLTLDVVESIGVGEEIKTRSGDWRKRIDNYKQSLRHCARAGVKVFCYNFMAITDWTRTELLWPAPGGGLALRFDAVDFAAYDLFLLEREGARQDYTPERVAAAHARFEQLSPDRRADLERTLIDWLPARDFTYDRASFREALQALRRHRRRRHARQPDRFRARDHGGRRGGRRAAGDPSRRPAFPIFGLPRVMSTADDVRKLFEAVPSPACGVTFCAGSFGSNAANDLPAMADSSSPLACISRICAASSANPTARSTRPMHLEGDGGLIEARRAADARGGTPSRREPRRLGRSRCGRTTALLIGADDPNRSNPGYSTPGA